MILIPALFVLLVPTLQSVSQVSTAWITPEEQAKLVRDVSAHLPAGWVVVRQELNRTPSGWYTTDTRGFEIEGRNGDQAFHVWILPNDWIGIRRAKPIRGRWGAEVFGTPNFKAIVDADYPVYHALEPLQKSSVSLVNGGQLTQTFRDRMDEVEKKTQELINRYCNDQTCRDEAAYSLIVLGVPARKIFLDCAEHGSGEPQEVCAEALGPMKDAASRQVLERVVSSPATSSATRRAAAYSLQQIGNASSGPALLEGLRNAPWSDAMTAIVSALEDLQYEPAAPEILRRMESDPEPSVFEWWFIRALASLRYTPAIPAIQMRCRTTELSSEWILEEARVRKSVDLDVPEISLLRLTAAWGRPSEGIRILLVAPATLPETGRIQVAVLMENGGSYTNNSLLMAFFSGSVIVDGVLFYSVVAMMLAVLLIVFRERSLMGVSPQALSNACENLVLIAVAFAVWMQRK